MVDTGWLCPRCERINSPAVTSCDCSDDYDYESQVSGYVSALPLVLPEPRSKSIPKKLREIVYERSAYHCVFCGENLLDKKVDSFPPKRGIYRLLHRGTNIENLIAACKSCGSVWQNLSRQYCGQPFEEPVKRMRQLREFRQAGLTAPSDKDLRFFGVTYASVAQLNGVKPLSFWFETNNWNLLDGDTGLRAPSD